MESEKALIEAILFLEGDPIDVKTIVKISGLSREQVEQVVEMIREDYTADDRGMELISIDGALQLVPKRELWPRLRERFGKKRENRLSRAAMETLSIIAYSQPITRGEIETLRGVAADTMIRQLLDRGLIKETGRKDAPGRPAQYGTTRHFLQHFNLESIADLPRLDEIEQERFSLNG
ncbi:segregation and condensation protein B [Alkalispirochaeta americana]|uniref:Segregation and condensation protein B n=1 Tax=Alkalispirochaeta americana TaxID=159291 RepID=A0A1N6P6U8_9SPIO|nr:SMC-Scp complex subunit ScpB [Alkalispirochaeta americana]SIQ00118.1 segregation and condensation protein B [Alkalispirochaeta americana]